MTKREVKGLNQTGRVSVKRTQAASALIQKSAAKNGARTKDGESRVTVGRTATGKKVVAFRVVAERMPDKEEATKVRLRPVTRNRT